MSDSFFKLRYHRDHDPQTTAAFQPAAVRGLHSGPGDPNAPSYKFTDDETAARYYLAELFGRDQRPSARALRGDEQPQVVPDLVVEQTLQLRLTDTRMLRFQQTLSRIPVFGSSVAVELDDQRNLVSITGQVAGQPDVSPLPTIVPAVALQKIAEAACVDLSRLESAAPPTLTFYQEEDDNQWYLAYFFRDVPAAPRQPQHHVAPPTRKRSAGHGPGSRSAFALHNYLVDAHSGKILFHYSATPLLTKGEGKDDDGNTREIYTTAKSGAFFLDDPLRRIKTYDLRFKDVGTSLPPTPICHTNSMWAPGFGAAVSAHYHASVVYDFFNSVLFRDGVDGKGMDIISLISATDSQSQNPPEWSNACWWRRQMWYGQEKVGDALRSWARYLDIVAHELTHGVTEFACGLIYKNQSGALNESFSDIFAVHIKNWVRGNPHYDDPSKWDWEIGAGLGDNGLPLRDMSNPGRTGDPDHMKDYWTTTADEGGVHTNSNIHNKAAWNLLTAMDGNNPAIKPRDVAILYYLTLTRLPNRAKFIDVRDQLLDVARTYFSGNPRLSQRLCAIETAYREAGIQ